MHPDLELGLSHEEEMVDNNEPDDEELTLTDYARCHGLTTDHRQEYPLESACLPSPSNDLWTDLQDPQGCLNIGTLVAVGALHGHTTKEKWDVNKESAECLASVLNLGKGSSDNMAGLIDLPKLKDLKLQEPILASDPEFDVLRLKHRNAITLMTADMEPFPLDDEKGETLIWSKRDLKLPAEIEHLIASEKLEVDRGTMEYIRGLSCPPDIRDKETVVSALEQERVVQPKRITPPLLPLLPPFSPGGLSGLAGELELTSTPENLIALEAADMERQIMEQDDVPVQCKFTSFQNHTRETGLAELYSPLRSPAESSPSPLKWKMLRHLKADVPLTPQYQSESPEKKSNTMFFPDNVHHSIPSPDSDMSILDPKVAEQDLDVFVRGFVAPVAEPAIQQAENEKLVEIDTTMRVTVPPIDLVELLLPWKIFGNPDLASQKLMLSQIKREITKDGLTWSGVSKIERSLPWSPFPARLGKVELEESFDDRSLARYRTELTVDDQIDVESLLWDPGRLKLLEMQDDEEDELEAVTYDEDQELQVPRSPMPEPPSPPLKQATTQNTAAGAGASKSAVGRMDMQTLLRKRKLELEATRTIEERGGINTRDGLEGSQETKRHQSNSAIPGRFADFTNNNGLSSFINLHRGPGQASHALPKQESRQTQQIVSLAIMIEPAREKASEPRKPQMPLPAPTLADTARPSSIVVSSSLLMDRELMRLVQIALPTVEWVERDASISSAMSADQSNTPSTSQEADITLSPSTGLIITTLQKLKQKPLPGQSTFFGVRERIVAIALRYERLVVLVSEGRQLDSDGSTIAGTLDARDTEALSDLMGFVSVLKTNVEVYYVPGGYPELVDWIAASVSRHAIVDGEVKLLQDETLWEHLLRKAGMNAYAAQAILAKLKMPDISHGGDNSSAVNSSIGAVYGLPAFMQMTADQRVDCFGPLVGGDRVLRQVSGIIDGRWKMTKF